MARRSGEVHGLEHEEPVLLRDRVSRAASGLLRRRVAAPFGRVGEEHSRRCDAERSLPTEEPYMIGQLLPSPARRKHACYTQAHSFSLTSYQREDCMRNSFKSLLLAASLGISRPYACVRSDDARCPCICQTCTGYLFRSSYPAFFGLMAGPRLQLPSTTTVACNVSRLTPRTHWLRCGEYA